MIDSTWTLKFAHRRKKNQRNPEEKNIQAKIGNLGLRDKGSHLETEKNRWKLPIINYPQTSLTS